MADSARFASAIALPAVGPEAIIHDYEYVLADTAIKQVKRLKRFRMLCSIIMPASSTEYLSAFFARTVLPTPCTEEALSPDDVRGLFQRAVGDDSAGGCIEGGDIDSLGCRLKQGLGAELTAGLNASGEVYRHGCALARDLLSHLRKDGRLREALDSGRILFMLKGSMAQKRVLAARFAESAEVVEGVFGSGGDNDTSFLIDPSLSPEAFGALHTLLGNEIHAYLLGASVDAQGIVARNAAAFTSITLAGIEMQVTPAERRSIWLQATGAEGVGVLGIDNAPRAIYVSRNDTPRFTTAGGDTAHFELLRLKQAFTLNLGGVTRICGGEVLDISIPFQDTTQLGPDFHSYSTKAGWLERITV